MCRNSDEYGNERDCKRSQFLLAMTVKSGTTILGSNEITVESNTLNLHTFTFTIPVTALCKVIRISI